jgi:general stress protein YciG
MSGTKEGGLRAAQTNLDKYGKDFYANIGAMGGKAGTTGGFYANRELAKEAGRKGGLISRRTRITSNDVERITQESKKGKSIRELANNFELSRNTIARIIKTGR